MINVAASPFFTVIQKSKIFFFFFYFCIYFIFIQLLEDGKVYISGLCGTKHYPKFTEIKIEGIDSFSCGKSHLLLMNSKIYFYFLFFIFLFFYFLIFFFHNCFKKMENCLPWEVIFVGNWV